MSKSKKALIIATILIVVGIVGAIPTGIYAIPKLINDVESNINSIQYKEKDIATFKEDIENLNLEFNIMEYSLEFRKSKDNLVHLKTYEHSSGRLELDRSYEDSTKTLNLKLHSKFRTNFFKDISFKNGIVNFVTDIYKSDRYNGIKLIIEVPKGVNIKNIGNQSSNVSINVLDSEVLKDSIYIKNNIRELKLPKVNTLKNVYIQNQSNFMLRLDLREFINAETVDLHSRDLSITSEGSLSDYNIKNIPSKFNVTGESIDINTFIPLAKEANINSSNLHVQMPFDTYNVSGKILDKSIAERDDEYRNNNDFSNENFKFQNLNLKLNNGVYEGKYSPTSGDEYKLNINAYGGEIVNTALSQLEMILQGR